MHHPVHESYVARSVRDLVYPDKLVQSSYTSNANYLKSPPTPNPVILPHACKVSVMHLSYPIHALPTPQHDAS